MEVFLKLVAGAAWEIIDIVTYMGINSQQLFYGVDGIIKEANLLME